MEALLPHAFSTRWLSARAWAALAAAVGAAACAGAGLYPRFDEGRLRAVLAVTSALFAAAIVAYASTAKTRASAFGAALGTSTLLGVAATIVPSIILASQDRSSIFGACLVFGVVFGAPTGFLYGLPLATLAATVNRDANRASLSASDRAARASGIWLAAIACVALAGTLALDRTPLFPDRGRAWETETVVTPAILACAAFALGVVAAVRAFVRLARRTAWVARVSAGELPGLRLRRIDARDVLASVPRLGDGPAVVEWAPAVAVADGAQAAYRDAALGVPVAVVDAEISPFM